VAASLNNLALLAYLQNDWGRAADHWRRSTDFIKRHAERGAASGRTDASDGEARQLAWQFWGLIKATHRLPAQSPTAAAEMFEAAQWAQASRAAVSLAQMAARSAKGSPQLAGLVRERQDLLSEWQTKDKLLVAAKGAVPAGRPGEAETALAGRLAAIDKRLAAIDGRLARDFPDYAALASPAPASLAEVQAQLGADEALVLFLDIPAARHVPEESFIWVVTKTEVRWVRLDLGTAGLGREVAALRCGLDETAWAGDGRERCAKTSGMAPVLAIPNPPPFDYARAHKLYLSLFAEVRHLIGGKHLLIVPSGPLAQLPFQALVTEAPTAAGTVAWLARSHAVTILPAVSSLKALRRVGRPSAATRPMIGFGNPLLDGNPNDADDAARAKLARAKQRCPDAGLKHVAAAVRGRAVRLETRGGVADLTHLKMQSPLPETAAELCRVARDMKAEARDVRLGAQATEREVRRLSTSGELAKYRMVHFATHGALAGELHGTREPGLILTPPQKVSAEDDGYLSASEIAGLKLDADWVVLSACNTAAGAAGDTEALSGLARAFIYAQARALLVSHWAVDSDATVKLITGTVGAMARDAKVGRAEALRLAMLALIDNGAPHEAHPTYWAPFVVVGEGAAAR
jgi:CHAT domain-containing protein